MKWGTIWTKILVSIGGSKKNQTEGTSGGKGWHCGVIGERGGDDRSSWHKMAPKTIPTIEWVSRQQQIETSRAVEGSPGFRSGFYKGVRGPPSSVSSREWPGDISAKEGRNRSCPPEYPSCKRYNAKISAGLAPAGRHGPHKEETTQWKRIQVWATQGPYRAPQWHRHWRIPSYSS